MNELIVTADGSHTIYVPELKEHYHSTHGAVQESSLVYIRNGLGFSEADHVNIFEVGFGTGLNALLSAIYGSINKRMINYTSIERYPLPGSIINALNHFSFAGEDGDQVFNRIHGIKWGSPARITDYFVLNKIKCDLVNDRIEGNFNLIFFDAFGPDKQPEMWTDAVFRKIATITEKGGVLVTYSSKGDVKRTLKSNGFRIELLPGPPGKREMIRATKL